ncbi:putative oxygenase MesX [Microbacterium koreense]|uniref:Oxygenase MesX n=1 Tax=Microbacterium koreense TaxID=323761 RepID=A0ABW2ZNQ5_9MICO
MASAFTFSITTTPFDEHYMPSEGSRLTTNFANLARGEHRQDNLRKTLAMIDRRFNDLARWDNPTGDRYRVELDIVSVQVDVTESPASRPFPLLEVLDTRIVDSRTGALHHGIVGNNFSSYVRDFDFSVVLPSLSDGTTPPSIPDDFGALHGKLYRHFVSSAVYRERFAKAPVICISVSTSKTYHRSDNRHPVLGVEYRQDDPSLTDAYFARMGLKVRYFMPEGSVAPLAFYFCGDLLNDYSNLELISTISTMETFQKIYRPEIYNANSTASAVYRPSLESQDFSRTQIDYDRAERSRLAVTQGTYAEEHFIAPHRDLLRRWASDYPAQAA